MNLRDLINDSLNTIKPSQPDINLTDWCRDLDTWTCHKTGRDELAQMSDEILDLAADQLVDEGTYVIKPYRPDLDTYSRDDYLYATAPLIVETVVSLDDVAEDYAVSTSEVLKAAEELFGVRGWIEDGSMTASYDGDKTIEASEDRGYWHVYVDIALVAERAKELSKGGC